MLHNCVSNPLTALAGRLKFLREEKYLELAQSILVEAFPSPRPTVRACATEAQDSNRAQLLSEMRHAHVYAPGF